MAEVESELPDFTSLFEPQEDHVCNFGDIVLVADDGFHPVIEIKASSCILANASKVFEVLLNKRFAEGHALRQGETNEVCLQDKPKAMLLMCQLIHLRPPPEDVSSEEMLDLAFLVDKFACVDALRLPTHRMLTLAHENDTRDADDYSRHHWLSQAQRHSWQLQHLVTAAYLLDQPDLFRQFTAKMVLSCTFQGEQLETYCTEPLPFDLLQSLKAQQSLATRELTYQVTKLVQQFSEAASRVYKPNLISDLITSLRVANLMPFNTTIASIETFLSNLTGITVPILKVDERQRYQITHDGWGDIVQEPSSYPDEAALRITANSICKQCAGICLDCVRGRDTCRTSHPDPWYDDGWEPMPGYATLLVQYEVSEEDVDEWDVPARPRPIRPLEWDSTW